MATNPPVVRDPRAVWARLLVLALAVAVGLLLQHLLAQHLGDLQALAQNDPAGARAQFAGELRVGGLGLFALTGAVGASFVATGRRGIRLALFPPPGAWSWGAARTYAGPAARRLAGVALVLGLMLVLCSIAGAALAWEMAERLLACRAG